MKKHTKMERHDGKHQRRHGVAGLLSALLLATPFTGLGQGYIGVDVHNEVNLNTTFPGFDTVTVGAGVKVDNSGSGSYAIFGDTHSWNLINSSEAKINGVISGVELQAGGNVTNLSGASIGGGTGDGLHIIGGPGNVDNSGTIFAGSPDGDDGVDMDNGGTINNRAGATIYGNDDAISTHGYVSVVNANTITGNNDDGVNLHDGGTVENQSGASIQGYDNGVEINDNIGSVVNTNASITGTTGNGVEMDSGGSVDNQRNGTIQGGQSGIVMSDFGVKNNALKGSGLNVLNAGVIHGTNEDGVQFHGSGNVTNLSNGTIIGGDDGVYVEDGYGYVENHSIGSITGQNDEGVRFKDGGSVNNDGSIYGGDNGVHISGSSGYVFNGTNATITGDGRDGVRMDDGGTVVNYGNITGRYGVEIDGGVGKPGESKSANTVNNYGYITGNGRSGVRLRDGGSVYNYNNIHGNHDGVHISGSEGYVYNEGTITGDEDNGVQMDSYGTVVNYGTIEGSLNYDLVEKLESGNSGNGDGVQMHDGGNVYNYYGSISGGDDGVYIEGSSGYVVNYTSITGYNGDGVRMRDGGEVDNYGGVIHGNHDGVHISGENNKVYNYGEIIGENHNGVQLDGGGEVYNYSGGNIQGGNGEVLEGNAKASPVNSGTGIKITGDDAYVYNAGTVTGSGGVATTTLVDGGSGWAILFGNGNDTLVLNTGSVLNGNVNAGGNTEQMKLGGDDDDDSAPGEDALILHGTFNEDSTFYNFETMTMDGTHVTLTGDNEFTTGVDVENGILSIGTNGVGSLTTPEVTVGTNGTIGGTGPIHAAVTIAGKIAPGNSIGTETIDGQLKLESGSIYEVEANATSADRIDVTGDPGNALISPDAVVKLVAHNDVFALTKDFVILSATNGLGVLDDEENVVSNRFNPVVMENYLFLDGSLLYPENGNDVLLHLTRVPFSSAALTYNQRGVAQGLDTAALAPGALFDLLADFLQMSDPTTARAAMDSLSGEIHGTAGMLAGQQSDAFIHSISLRTGRISSSGNNGGYAANHNVQLAANGTTTLPAMEADKSWGIWAQGFGSFGDVTGDGNATKAVYTIGGFDGGLDYRLSPDMLVGVAVGYSQNDISGSRNATANVDDIQFAAYGGYVNGPWHFDGILSYGLLSTDTRRVLFNGQVANGKYDGGIVGLSAEAGYAFVAGPFSIQPTLGVNYSHLSQDSFTETGTAGPNGLHVGDVSMDSFQTSVGVRLAGRFGSEGGVQFVPALRVAWEHEFGDQTATLTERFIGAGSNFNVRGVELGTESGVIGLGITVEFNKSVQAFLNYDARLNEQLTSQSVSGGLSVGW